MRTDVKTKDSRPREIVVISGKGGTGKTSLAASLAVLAGNAVIADCDVDAADLHLILKPRVLKQDEFRSGNLAVIRHDDCTGCGLCRELCRFDAVRVSGEEPGQSTYRIDPVACEGCGVCVRFCPAHAIDFPEQTCGSWMVSQTRCGPMVHAQLGIAAENSGKLVTLVRQEARRIATESGYPLVIVDGPPGIGCPVIASLSGASVMLAVTEPTVSGEHDLERVLALARHFGVQACVCVNKWDLNPEMTEQIERHAKESGALTLGRIRYDKSVTRAQISELSVVELESQAGMDIREIWKQLNL